MKYIPLGGTCCIAYQLNEHNLRSESLPFDWIRINNFNNVISLLDNNFDKFFESLQFLDISDKFIVNGNFKSYIYKNNFCKFYHDFNSEINEKIFIDFKNKYIRRINRLYNLLKEEQEVVFIREEIGKLNENKLINFKKVINKINSNLKWKLIIITSNNNFKKYESNEIKIIISNNKIIDWKRYEINWYDIFTNT